MKSKSSLLLLFLGMFLALGLSSCSSSDDDGCPDCGKTDEHGLTSYRAFVLTEGSFGKNNSHLFFLDPKQDTTSRYDIYEAQNGKRLGDTANEMIAYDGKMYIVVNVSKVLLALDNTGKEVARFTDFETLGEPRNLVASKGKIYVTCYGGYVARFDAKTLALEAKVQVDANPEQIIALDGKLYCVNSGMSMGNTMSIVDEAAFTLVKNVQIMQNPQKITTANGHIYITATAYDENWNSDTRAYLYDRQKETYKEIGPCTSMVADGDDLYMVSSTTPDYRNFTSTYSIYNAKTGTTKPWALQNAPAIVLGGVKTVYMLKQNPYDKSFYVGVTDYISNSDVYHFSSDGKFIKQFSAGGINSNSMVFFK